MADHMEERITNVEGDISLLKKVILRSSNGVKNGVM